jgi:hypothetical protein
MPCRYACQLKLALQIEPHVHTLTWMCCRRRPLRGAAAAKSLACHGILCGQQSGQL